MCEADPDGKLRPSDPPNDGRCSDSFRDNSSTAPAMR